MAQQVDLAFPGIPGVSDVFSSVVNLIGNLIFGGGQNTLIGAIKILAAKQSLDVSVEWFRALLSVELALMILLLVMTGIIRAAVAGITRDFTPFVIWMGHMVRALLFAPFIPGLVMALVYISDVLRGMAVAVATIGGSQTAWQSKFGIIDPAGHFFTKVITYVGGIFLYLETAPLAALGIFWTAMLMLTLGIGLLGDTGGRLYRISVAGLLSSIFAPVLMLFVMALAGNILANFTTGGVDTAGFNVIMLVFVAMLPFIMFFGIARSMKQREKARRAEAQRVEVANTVTVEQADLAYARSQGGASPASTAAVAREAAIDKALERSAPIANAAIAARFAGPYGMAAGLAAETGIHAVRAVRKHRSNSQSDSGG